jgi:hypothetical protein
LEDQTCEDRGTGKKKKDFRIKAMDILKDQGA